MSNPPIQLSDSQLWAIIRASRPLRPEALNAYFEVVAAELRACPELGDGSVFRAVRIAQHLFLEPPTGRETNGPAAPNHIRPSKLRNVAPIATDGAR
jgi:hypothetical protein